MQHWRLRSAVWIILFGSVLLAMGWHSPAVAYFEFESDKRSVHTVIKRSDTFTGTTSHVLVLSDNDEFHGNFFFDSQEIQAADWRHFIFADYLPLTDVATQLKNRMNTDDFKIEGLLYANLKLAGLLNEYEEMRKRAESTLKGLDVPYLQWKEAYRKPLETGNTDISGQMQWLVDQSNLAVRPNLPVLRFNNPAASSTRENFKNPNLRIRRFINLPPLNQHGHQSFRNHASSTLQNDRTGENENTVREEKRKVQFGSDQEGQKPWPIQLLTFIFSNKIIAILFFVMLNIIFWLLSALRNK